MNDACVLIFAESGAKVGMGHQRRSEVILESLERKNIPVNLVKVVCADDGNLGFSLSRGDRLGGFSDRGSVSFNTARVAIIDMQAGQLRNKLRCRINARSVLVIDDTGSGPIDAEWVVNPNFGFSKKMYTPWNIDRLEGGSQWLIQKKVFFSECLPTSCENDQIVVYLGGATSFRDTKAFLECLELAASNRKIFVPLSKECSFFSELDAWANSRDSDLQVLLEPNIRDLLLRSSVYVGGAGQMSIQALLSGCSLVLFETAADQKYNLRALVSRGAEAASVPVQSIEYQTLADLIRLAEDKQSPDRSGIRDGTEMIAHWVSMQ